MVNLGTDTRDQLEGFLRKIYQTCREIAREEITRFAGHLVTPSGGLSGGGMPWSTTPEIVLGETPAGGTNGEVIRSDATVKAFNDATLPVDLGVSPAAGAAPYAARVDHVHRGNSDTLANPMTTINDLILGGASGAPGRLATGTDGQVLTVDPTTHNVIWSTPPTPRAANPMTTAGDLILGGTAGVEGRLAKGTDSQVLTVDPTSHLPVWSDPVAAATGRYRALTYILDGMGSFNFIVDGLGNPITVLQDLE